MSGGKTEEMGRIKTEEMGGVKTEEMGGVKTEEMVGIKTEEMGGVKTEEMGGGTVESFCSIPVDAKEVDRSSYSGTPDDEVDICGEGSGDM